MVVGGNNVGMSSRLRVLIVEDEPWIRRSAEEMLRGEGVDVVALARGRDAIQAARGTSFDAALVDLGLPDVSGIEVIAELRQLAPACTPVAFTVFDDAPTILAALRAGARGYVLKSTPTERIVPLLREAIAGGMPLSPTVASLVVETMLGHDAGKPSAALTERESELLALLARGATYAQCAEALGIGVGTVQSYVKSIYMKLDVGSKAEAAVIAVRLGLVT
jgi:DNA-binding NarL/FixJ family response regulator